MHDNPGCSMDYTVVQKDVFQCVSPLAASFNYEKRSRHQFDAGSVLFFTE